MDERGGGGDGDGGGLSACGVLLAALPPRRHVCNCDYARRSFLSRSSPLNPSLVVFFVYVSEECAVEQFNAWIRNNSINVKSGRILGFCIFRHRF